MSDLKRSQKFSFCKVFRFSSHPVPMSSIEVLVNDIDHYSDSFKYQNRFPLLFGMIRRGKGQAFSSPRDSVIPTLLSFQAHKILPHRA
jgi:hypothetical protein